MSAKKKVFSKTFSQSILALHKETISCQKYAPLPNQPHNNAKERSHEKYCLTLAEVSIIF